MKFGPVPVKDAEGALLAHSIVLDGLRLKKAHRLTRENLDALAERGVATIIVARLDAGDVEENAAAERLARSLSVEGVEIRAPATGRVNIHAEQAGVFTVDKALIDEINRIDPALTIATLAPFDAVQSGQMVATVKIIPFAVGEDVLGKAAEIARRGRAFAVHAFRPHRIGLIQTTLPTVKPSVLDKTARVTQERLTRSQSEIVTERRVAHGQTELAKALGEMAGAADLVLVFGASALCDAEDVIPAAIGEAGGSVERIGMPVDPGNLVVLGTIGGTRIVGAPGCARSPKPNGFDWVLDRIMAGIDISSADIAAMGVGGLLMEIPTRPQPREQVLTYAAPVVHAAILAAGRSSRMGGPNKLLSQFEGVPLIRKVAQAVRASRVNGLSVIVGHQGARVATALEGIEVQIAENPNYIDGLSTSLKVARHAALDADGLLVVLGDMPHVSSDALDRMIAAFRAQKGLAIVRATHGGKRGNPVILPKALFAEIDRIEGDTGARHLVEGSALPIIDVELGEAASLDLDTQDAVRRAGGTVEETA